jgi:ATP-dependent 26S proteasome regulatory subunit
MPTYNYAPKDYPKFKDNFYNELFHTWAKIHLITPKNVEEICEQPIWHNTHIKSNKKTRISKMKIKLTKLHSRYYQWKERNTKKERLEFKIGNICRFLEYESLISAIKKEWKQTLREKTSINVNYIIQQGCYIIINKAKNKIEQIRLKDIYDIWYQI